MDRKLSWVALFAILLVPAIGHAVEPTRPSPYDYRLKTAVYNRNDTVEIDSVIGLQTHIEVAPDERYVTHAFGDDKAWVFSPVDNHFFIKPKEADGDTNLTIVTTKRVYHLLIHYIGDYRGEGTDGKPVVRQIRTPWTMRQATIELRYRYPIEEARQASALREQARVQQALTAPELSPGPKNLSYRMSDDRKSREIEPENAWDDYHFTYFKFPANAELPTLFVIGADGKEHTVNVHVIGPAHNIIQAQMVAREWRLRYGKDRVVGILNDGFDPNRGANKTGTSAPNVERVNKVENRNGGEG